MQYGFVYIMRNDAMPNLYKVGMTTKPPSQRALELSRNTNMPSSFELVYYIETPHMRQLEKDTHAELSSYRVDNGREFFACPLMVIVGAIKRVLDEYSSEYTGSETMFEANNPGTIYPERPLWFEEAYYSKQYLDTFRSFPQENTKGSFAFGGGEA